MKKLIIFLVIALAAGALYFIFKPYSKNISIAYSFKTKDHLVYNVNQRTEILIKSKGAKASKTILGISGILHQKVYKVDEESYLFGFALEDAMLDIGRGVTEGEDQTLNKIQKDLNTEVFVKMDRYGRFLKLYSKSNIIPETKNLLKSLIVSSQSILPEKDSSSNWFRNELNMTGNYKAEYKVTDEDEDAYYIEKKKLQYTSISSEDEITSFNKPTTKVKILPEALELIEFDKEGYIFRLDHVEHTIMTSMGFNIEALILTKYDFQKKWKDEDINEISSIKTAVKKMKLEEFSVSGGETDKAQQKKNLLKRIGGLTLKQIYSKIDKLNHKEEGQEAFDLFRKIKAILTLNPEKVNELLDMADSLDPKDPQYLEKLALLMGTLDAVEAKIAQGKLMDLINKKMDNMTFLMQAIPALGTLRNPTSRGKDFLRGLVENAKIYDVKSLSALALGALSRQASSNNDRISDDAASYLSEKLNSSQNTKEKTTFILALGNTGNLVSLDSLKNNLNTGNEDLDSKSVFSLRFIPGEKVDDLIEDALDHSSKEVQKNALDAYKYRAPSKQKLKALYDYLFDIEDENLQISALYVLSDLYIHYPEDIKEIFNEVKGSNLPKKVKESVIDIELTL